MKHSSIVGGSSASRVIQCPASVKLCNKAPPKPSSSYADVGTLLHNVMDAILSQDKKAVELLGMKYQDAVLTQALIEDKIEVALALLDEIDPAKEMEYMTETKVHFGEVFPDVFGSTDLMGRLGDKAYIIDYKFGDGIAVSAEENKQLLFYAAAALRTPESQWVFEGVKEVELVIIQPPEIRRWVTTVDRVRQFEAELGAALKEADSPNPTLKEGDGCRWCAAKPTCPKMTGAVDRALIKDLKTVDAEMIGRYLKNAELLESWISALRELAFNMLEHDVAVPGYKLVAKRATRKWVDEDKARKYLLSVLPKEDVITESILSPAQAEKLMKKSKLALDESMITAISSGSTLAEESDARPVINNLAKQLATAMKKLN